MQAQQSWEALAEAEGWRTPQDCLDHNIQWGKKEALPVVKARLTRFVVGLKAAGGRLLLEKER